jgi:hypothetical protein
MLQSIYKIQNVLNSYEEKVQNDFIVTRLVTIQDKLIQKLKPEKREEVVQNLIYGRYQLDVIPTKQARLEALKILDEYSTKTDDKTSKNQNKQVEFRKVIGNDAYRQTRFEGNVKDLAKTQYELDRIKLLQKNGWEDEEIIEQLKLEIK